MIDSQRLKTDLLALALLAGVVFCALSLFSFHPADPPSDLVYPANEAIQNVCGPAGARLSTLMRTWFGFGAWGLVASVLVLDLRLFSRQKTPDPGVRMVGTLMGIAAICFGLQLFVPKLGWMYAAGSGGLVGAYGAAVLRSQFSIGGSLIIIATLLLAGGVLTGDVKVLRVVLRIASAPVVLVGRVLKWLLLWTPSRVEQHEEADHEEEAKPRAEIPVRTAVTAELAPPEKPLPIAVKPPLFKVNPPTVTTLGGASAGGDRDAYQLPSVDLLDHAEEFPFELLAEKAQGAAAILEKTFDEFGLNVRVAEIDTGPVVTQFELALEPGLRVSKVVNLADDLAIALRVPSVRVVSPIPGKNTVGVEVPNEKRVMVRLRELLLSSTDSSDMALPLYLGKDVSGHPMVVDLARMPHLLIAGRTGTGKSVCLNTLILSLLMTKSPDDVKMLMIDPKMVELSPYMRIPHLMHPVITDMKKAEAVLAWAVEKMEERYDLLARCGVRHLDGYNNLGKEEVLDRAGIDPDSEEADRIPERMPYIVIIADEMADMMMTSGKDVEGHIIRLAQKSRAVGIHLVLATQKPTVDVITGLIKSNLPARISFQVSSRMDSRVVLDEMGAERLLGYGDMLYLAPGTSCLTRSQGTYVADDEVNAVIGFFKDQPPQYSEELAQLDRGETGGGLDAIRDRDEMYQEAIDVVVREQRGSVSLLQRALGIGYGRAARMIDYMAEDGIVGDYNGAKCREVLYTVEQWEAIKATELVEA